MQEKTMEKTIYDYQINPAKIAPNRSVTPVAIRMQGNQPLPLVLKTPETQLKVTKTYRSVSPSPNLVHTRMESQKGIAIENANPAFLRIQNINHDKNKLYEELNKLNSENNSLNIKIMEMQKRFNEHSSNLQHNDVFLKELVKIKEILEKYDISSFYQKKPIEPMDFHSLQYTIANISKHLKFFEDKLFALWSETDRLGKELINWQTYCTHQETVSQIRFQDLKNQYQQFFNEQAKAPQLIAFCDNEYKNRIKNLEDRVNDLEFGIVSLKVEKEFLVKEINEKNSCIRQFQEKCDTAKQTYDQKVILLTSQLEKMNEIAGESHNRENNLLYENQQLKLQIQNLAANRNELLSKLAKLDQEIMQLREISARFKNENDDFVEKKPNKVSSKEERENFQSSLESLKHKNLEIEQELESLQISKKELELNHNLDQKQIDELLLQNKELQISIAKIQREEKYLKNTNEELEQKISEWMEKYKKLEKEYAEEIEEIKVTYEEEKILGLNDAELKNQTEVKSRDAEILYLQKIIKEKDENINRANLENKELEDELLKIKEQLITFDEKVEQIEEISRKKEEKLENECQTLKKKLKALQQAENNKIYSSEKSQEQITIQEKNPKKIEKDAHLSESAIEENHEIIASFVIEEEN